MAQLPQLSSLSLGTCAYSAVSLGALSHLSGSLTYLSVYDGSAPSSLRVLTRLRHLELTGAGLPEGDAGIVSDALPHMKQLTWLVRVHWVVAVATTNCACMPVW